MQKNVYIYNEELELIAQPFITSYEEFKENPETFYPDWAVNMHSSEVKIEYPILDGEQLREKTREERIKDGELDLLEDGEYFEDGKIVKIEYDKSLDYLKPTWNREMRIWEEGATPEERVTKIGEVVTKLLFEALDKGCVVRIKEQEYVQCLDDRKINLMTSRVASLKLAEEFKMAPETITWPFKDDGTDTVTMTLQEYKLMALECTSYADICYKVAEILKSKNKISLTIEDFAQEVEKLTSSSVLSLK